MLQRNKIVFLINVDICLDPISHLLGVFVNVFSFILKKFIHWCRYWWSIRTASWRECPGLGANFCKLFFFQGIFIHTHLLQAVVSIHLLMSGLIWVTSYLQPVNQGNRKGLYGNVSNGVNRSNRLKFAESVIQCRKPHESFYLRIYIITEIKRFF